METRIVYLVRHGKIAEDGGLPRYIGQLDVPLSEHGRAQARELARRLAGAGLGSIYCSDLSRSLETARTVSAAAGAPVVVRRDLREVSLGAWEGCAFRDIALRFPEAYRARGEDFAGFRPPGGESFEDCRVRVVRAFHELLATSKGDVLLVGHAGVNRLLLCHVLGVLPPNLFRLGQDCGGCNVIRLEGSRYQVALVNGQPSDLRFVRRPARAPRAAPRVSRARRVAAQDPAAPAPVTPAPPTTAVEALEASAAPPGTAS